VTAETEPDQQPPEMEASAVVVPERAAVDVVPESQPRAAMVPVPVASSRFRDVASDLQCAAQAVRYIEVVGVQADISTTLQLAVVVTGSAPAQALTAAAAFARESPMAEIHSVAWARVQGPVRDLDEFRITMIVSYPDGEGEYTGTTDRAPRT
jgi:hypothetical protein